MIPIAPADRRLCHGHMEAGKAHFDALVYELYGLTEEEISIVEGRELRGSS